MKFHLTTLCLVLVSGSTFGQGFSGGGGGYYGGVGGTGSQGGSTLATTTTTTTTTKHPAKTNGKATSTAHSPAKTKTGKAAATAAATRSPSNKTSPASGSTSPSSSSSHLFNKCSDSHNTTMTYPVDEKLKEDMLNGSAVSLRLYNDPEVRYSKDECEALLAGKEKSKCTHPHDASAKDRAQFWDEFEWVLDLQKKRKAGSQASEVIDLPKIFDGKTIEEAAQAVKSDFPTKWPTTLLESFLTANDSLSIDHSIFKHRGNEFVDKQVMLARLIGWAVSEVSPSAFAMKWNIGRIRPEEVAWKLKNGAINATGDEEKSVVEKLKGDDYIKSLGRPEDFTAYADVGCPVHPAYPAMHSAASAASLYLPVVLELSTDEIREARLLDYAVATFRSMAGVHYESDNRAGLGLGAGIIAKALPKVLEEWYGNGDGSVRRAVEGKLARVTKDFSWETWKAKQ